MLELIDKWFYKFLEKNVSRMPLRFKKMVAYYYTDARIRKLYWKELGVLMGKDTYANLGMIRAYGELLDPNEMVYIGNNVTIAPNLTLVTHASAVNGVEINKNPYVSNNITTSGSIIIEDDVWIGVNVTILPGITIGKCSVLGAGSVVLENVDEHSIYAGVPAKKIRSLKSEEINKE